MHGIRDFAERFHELQQPLYDSGKSLNVTVISAAPRYKYFSALQFILPGARQNKLYEFADLYTELLATSPISANINFIGHSFGTYLMLKSTDDYSSMKYFRAYLAGSVLKESFFGTRQLLGKRIDFVRNDIAAFDWPVDILCSALSYFPFGRDIGTGGFNGFTQMVNSNAYIKQRVSLEELNEFFDKVETTHTFEGDPVWQLKRKRKAQAKLRRADLAVLPTELWVRQSLLNSSGETSAIDLPS
jgi:hypothetical protein